MACVHLFDASKSHSNLSGENDMSATSWTLPDDPLGAFCRHNHVALAGSGQGPLAGLTFAVKDLFHIAGARTGFGTVEVRTCRSHGALRPQSCARHPSYLTAPRYMTAAEIRRHVIPTWPVA